MGYCSILWWWNRDFTHGYGINPWWTQKKDSTQLSEVESPSRMNKILICLPQDFTQHFSQSLDCDKWPAALESRNICLQDHDDHNMLEIEQTSCGCNELDTKLCSPETKKTWMTTTYSCLLIIFLCVEYNTFQFVTNMVSHPKQLWAYRPRTALCPRSRSPEFAQNGAWRFTNIYAINEPVM